MKNKFLKRVLTIILIGYFVYFVNVWVQQEKKISELRKESEYYAEQVRELKKEKEEILKQQNNIKNEEYIDAIARNKLDMFKPNDRIYTFDSSD